MSKVLFVFVLVFLVTSISISCSIATVFGVVKILVSAVDENELVELPQL